MIPSLFVRVAIAHQPSAISIFETSESVRELDFRHRPAWASASGGLPVGLAGLTTQFLLIASVALGTTAPPPKLSGHVFLQRLYTPK